MDKSAPHCTVATIIEDKQKFLLVYEQRGDRMRYNQPAGHLEENESLQDAAIRETLEETAWQVELEHYMGVCVYKAPANGVCYVRHSFAARPINKTSRELDVGIQEAVWLSLEEIEARKDELASPLVLDDIYKYLSGKFYPLEAVESVLS